MRLGIIGRGPWGNVYAETLRRMGVKFWQKGLGWEGHPDGVIVATSANSHYPISIHLITRGVPALIEKPICLSTHEASSLLRGALWAESPIVFTGHTRLYAPSWRAFKARALERGVRSVRAFAGGPCKLAPLWDWGPHLVAMCLDLGFDPLAATIEVGTDEQPLTVIVNQDMAYIEPDDETPRPLEVLLTEFMAAIEKGEPDIRGLELGVKVVEALERIENREITEVALGT